VQVSERFSDIFKFTCFMFACATRPYNSDRGANATGPVANPQIYSVRPRIATTSLTYCKYTYVQVSERFSDIFKFTCFMFACATAKDFQTIAEKAAIAIPRVSFPKMSAKAPPTTARGQDANIHPKLPRVALGRIHHGHHGRTRSVPGRYLP
jgi:hypothetical protein